MNLREYGDFLLRDPHLRYRAVDILEIADKNAVDALINVAMTSKNDLAVVDAMRALAKIDIKEAFKLFRALQAESTVYVIEMCKLILRG
jgi:hypothetical protein